MSDDMLCPDELCGMFGDVEVVTKGMIFVVLALQMCLPPTAATAYAKFLCATPSQGQSIAANENIVVPDSGDQGYLKSSRRR